MSFSSLPLEMKFRIFSYLDAGMLCRSVQYVCQEWRELAKDECLWNSLTFVCDETTDPELMNVVFQNAFTLKKLIIQNRSDVLTIIRELFKTCEKLHSLILIRCDLLKSCNWILAEVLVRCQRYVKELVIKGCIDMEHNAYEKIVHFNELTSLNLSYSMFVDGQTMQKIVVSCSHLTSLHLSNMYRLNDIDIMCVLNLLFGQLTSLKLDAEHLTDRTFVKIGICTRLQVLKLDFCTNMTWDGLNGIAQLPNLTMLRLRKANILSADAVYKFITQANLSRLRKLDLSDCINLDNEGVQTIAQRCPLLKKISLCWCNEVTDAGLNALVENCSQMEVMVLTGLLITGEPYLSEIPNTMRYLKKLVLVQCPFVTDDTCLKLIQLKSDLEVLNYYGEDIWVACCLDSRSIGWLLSQNILSDM